MTDSQNHLVVRQILNDRDRQQQREAASTQHFPTPDIVEEVAKVISENDNVDGGPSEPDPHYAGLAEAVLSHLRAQGLLNEWRDISEAPKDRTVIDLFGTRNGEPRRFPDAWWDKEKGWFGTPMRDRYCWHHPGTWDQYGEFEYTHWMPKPPAPEKEKT